MIKRILILSLILMLLACTTINAATQTSAKVYDEANLLTDYERKNLDAKLEEISKDYSCEVIVATSERLYSTPEHEAKEVLQNHFELTADTEESGICLIVSMTDRKYGIYVLGEADDKIFKSSDLDDIEEAITPLLSKGEVYTAFCAFYDECADTIDYYRSVKVEFSWILISLGGGIALAFVVVLIMKSKLKSVRFQPAANNYLKENSLNLTQAKDIFLYSTVVRTEKPKVNSSGSSLGGGSGRSGSF